MTNNAIFSGENYFTHLDALTNKDWMYRLASMFPNGGITNMSRVMQLEVISQLPKDEHKEQIRSVVEEMNREKTAYLANKHREELQSSVEASYEPQRVQVNEIKAFL
ncbi:hypothetical protein [Vibrio fluvialis]|uniref:hypothetical protein n=1 Tax=Vibrio fluvialis TaxID=676 RepID=UPI0023A932C3|nr:hypothetical protein [Vibrio fluvialis]MDE5179025.1 hypothetical protein [Vibrio fluvialis]